MTTPKDILAKAVANNKKSNNELIIERTRGTLAASAVGAGLGLVYAYRAKKSYLVWGVLGLMIGGLISNIVINREINKPLPGEKTDEEE